MRELINANETPNILCFAELITAYGGLKARFHLTARTLRPERSIVLHSIASKRSPYYKASDEF